MTDLIDRQAALAELDKAAWGKDWDKALAAEMLKSLPSAQPERTNGKWLPVTHERGGHYCDRCNEYAPSFMNGDENLSNFCPNCGADMRGDDE